VLDGRAGLGNGKVLPRGPLREPLRALRRADAVVVLDGPLPPEDEARVRTLAPAARRLALQRVASSVRPLSGGDPQPPSALHGRRVGLMCGIARPASFRRSVEAVGARVVAERSFSDHHHYRAADLRGLSDEADCWVTTEKDAVKILPGWAPDVEILALRVGLRAEGEEPFLAWVEERLRAAQPGASGSR
jgi:tetraacyldisaccharide 4'-kinase